MSAFRNERNSWTAKFYYRDWNGKKRQKKKEGFETKKEAVLYEEDFLANTAGSPDIMFGRMCSLYLDDCRTRLKPTTVATKENTVSKQILPYFGELRINDISVGTVRNWQNQLIASDAHYSPTYLRACHNQLSSIFNFACKYYNLPSNPARICGSIGSNRRECASFWTPEEFGLFLSAVSDKPMSETMFSLLFFGGMREGELLALGIGDFDFELGTVSITKSYARLKGEDIIQSPKTAKSRRTITMPAEIMDTVRKYADGLEDHTPDKRLFPVTKKYLHYEMKRGTKLSGVRKIRIHDIRHSHASLLIELGFSPLLISERLGHEDVSTTLSIYSHLYPNKQSEVADKLSEVAAAMSA